MPSKLAVRRTSRMAPQVLKGGVRGETMGGRGNDGAKEAETTAQDGTLSGGFFFYNFVFFEGQIFF